MNNMILQLLCDIEFAICNCTSSTCMLATKLSVSIPFGVFIALLKDPAMLAIDDFLLLLPLLLASSPKK